MEAQNIIGKDLAKSMELMFGEIFDNNPEKMAIIKNTKLFKYFNGSTKINIPGYKTPYLLKITPTTERSKILLKLALDQYACIGVLDLAEYNNLKAMIESPDKENSILAEEILAIKFSPKFRKTLQKIKRLIKKK